MPRPYNPARPERARLIQLDQRDRARREACEVAAGVAETTALSRARGAALVVQLGAHRRPGPVRRLTGLDWLARKGRLTPAQKLVGERYGRAWRRAEGAARIGSSLNMVPGGGRDHDALSVGEARAASARRLAMLRAMVKGQGDLVAACDQICGAELTPREACANGVQAARLVGLLLVALDLMSDEQGSENSPARTN